MAIISAAYAQVGEQGTAERELQRAKTIVDKATEKARVMQRNNPTQPAEGFNKEKLQSIKGVDPVEIAERYKNSQMANANSQNSTLKFWVFISTSIPKKAQVMLARQAKEVGATLVLRGLKDKLGTPQALEKMITEIQPMAETGAEINIDPEAFKRFDVTAVPTFVIFEDDKEEGSCSTDQCKSPIYALQGDVTIDYALEHWSAQGGKVGQIADMYLNRMPRKK